jgi:hypothetical protein
MNAAEVFQHEVNADFLAALQCATACPDSHTLRGGLSPLFLIFSQQESAMVRQ